MRNRARPEAPGSHSVKDVLARMVPTLTRVTEAASRQNYWLTWLSQHLSPEIHARISGVTERHGVLVIFAESPAWSARLRFAVLEVEADLRAAGPQLTNIEVRVLPR
jgi:hypothetical protein